MAGDRLHCSQQGRERIREAMAARRMTDRDVAREVGCSHMTIHKLVTGKATTCAHLRAICAFLDIPLYRVLDLSPLEERWLDLLHDVEREACDDIERVTEIVESVVAGLIAKRG